MVDSDGGEAAMMVDVNVNRPSKLAGSAARSPSGRGRSATIAPGAAGGPTGVRSAEVDRGTPREVYAAPAGSMKDDVRGTQSSRSAADGDEDAAVGPTPSARRRARAQTTVALAAPTGAGGERSPSASRGAPFGAKETSYEAMVRKVSFLGDPYLYDALPIKPLVPFYKHLSRSPTGTAKQQRSTQGRLPIYLPDVIVYGEGEGPRWYYSSRDGYVYRSDTFSEKHIMSRLGNPANDTDLVAVLKRANFDNPAGNEISLLDTKDLRTIVSNPPAGLYCIQKFVKCKGPKAFVTRAVWRTGSPSFAWVISNRKNFDECPEADFKYRYCTATEIKDGTTIFRQTGKAVEETEALNNSLVTYLERNLRPRVRFTEFVADYIKDEQGRMWLLQVKAFRVDQESIPRGLGPGGGGGGDASGLGGGGGGEDSDDDDHMDRDADGRSKKPKDYKRLTRCKSCCAGYLPQDLPYEMTMKMIMETEEHLKRRGVVLQWFDRADARALATDPYLMYRTFRVCMNCYDLFQTEKKLIEIEREFAREIGVPEEVDPLEAARAAKSARSRGFEYGFVARDEAERRKMATRDINQKIPRGVPVKLQDNPSLKPVPERLTVYRLLTYFHEIQDFPEELAHFQRGYYLEYTIFNYTTRMRATVEPGFSTVPVHKLRVFHFLGTPDSLKALLTQQERIEVHLYTSQRRLVGTTSLPLRQFVSGIIEKLDLFQLFGNRDLGMARLKATLGIVRGDQVETKYLMGKGSPAPPSGRGPKGIAQAMSQQGQQSKGLHLYQGVYLPPPTFFTAAPLPAEWIDLIPSKDRQRRLKPAARAAAREREGDEAFGGADDTFAHTQTSMGLDDEVFGNEYGASSPGGGVAVPRSLSAPGVVEPSRIWCITVQVHSAHGLQLSNRDTWRVNYTLLRSKISSEEVAPSSLRRPLEFNTCDHFHVRCPPASVNTYFHWFPILEVAVTCATRGGASGLARIGVDGLLARGGGVEGAVEIKEADTGDGVDTVTGGGVGAGVGIGGGVGIGSGGVGVGGGGANRPGHQGIGSGEADGPWLSYSVSISVVDPATLSVREVDPETGLPPDIAVDMEVECGIEVLRVEEDDGGDAGLGEALVETGGRSTPMQRQRDADRIHAAAAPAGPSHTETQQEPERPVIPAVIAPRLPTTFDDDDDGEESNGKDYDEC